MSLEVLHLGFIQVQEELHVVRDVVQVGEGLVTIGKDLTCTVITGNDDVTLVGVHDVVSCQRGIA